MKLLALDSTTDLVTVGLATDGVVTDFIEQSVSRPVSESLVALVMDLLGRNSATSDALDLIVVATGPGSFNGIRGGIAAAEGYSFGLSIPITGVSTLDAMAQHGLALPGERLSVWPAGRGDLYYASYTSGSETPRHDCAIGRPDVVFAEYSQGTHVYGRLTPEMQGLADESGFITDADTKIGMRVQGLCACGYANWHAGRTQETSVRPIYVRSPNITTPKISITSW